MFTSWVPSVEQKEAKETPIKLGIPFQGTSLGVPQELSGHWNEEGNSTKTKKDKSCFHYLATVVSGCLPPHHPKSEEELLKDMPHEDCQRPSPDERLQSRRTQIRTILGRLRIKRYLSNGGWKSQAFLSLIPEWWASWVHLPNRSTEGDKGEIVFLKGTQSVLPIQSQLMRQMDQREESSQH